MRMPSFPAMRFVTGFLAVLALGCARDRDPLRIHIRDFDSGPALTDTLKKLLGPRMRVSGAWEMMQGNGFKCGERAGITVDTKAGKLGSGPPYLQCWQSSPIAFGLQRRDWTVTFKYDSSGVRDIYAGYIIQP
jgi:hypothetical protein